MADVLAIEDLHKHFGSGSHAVRANAGVTMRVGVATYLLAEGRFHRALHSTGADVVAAPIGDHPAVTDLVVHRYREQVA